MGMHDDSVSGEETRVEISANRRRSWPKRNGDPFMKRIVNYGANRRLQRELLKLEASSNAETDVSGEG